MHERSAEMQRVAHRRFGAWVLTTVVFSLLCTAESASAQARSAARPRLFFANATLGLGDCTGTLCSRGDDRADTGPLPGLGIGVFFRPIPYFAAGFELHHQWMSAEDGHADRFNESARDLVANLALRGILPLGAVEPWIGVGLGYAWWGYAWEKDKKDESVSVDGIDLAFSLGVDVAVAPHWAVGGMFRFALPSWGTRCRDSFDIRDGRLKTTCEDVDALDAPARDELPDSLWYLGATVRFDFGG